MSAKTAAIFMILSGGNELKTALQAATQTHILIGWDAICLTWLP